MSRQYPADRFKGRKVKKKIVKKLTENNVARALDQEKGGGGIEKIIPSKKTPPSPPPVINEPPQPINDQRSTINEVRTANLSSIFSQETEYKAPKAAQTDQRSTINEQRFEDDLDATEIEAHRIKPPVDDDENQQQAEKMRKSYTPPDVQAEGLLRLVNMLKTPWEKKMYRKNVLTDDAFLAGKTLNRAINRGQKKKEELSAAEKAIYDDYKEYLAEAEGIEWDDEEIAAMKLPLARGLEENGVQIPWWAEFLFAAGVVEQSRIRLIMKAE
jgi:hypothetical protein